MRTLYEPLRFEPPADALDSDTSTCFNILQHLNATSQPTRLNSFSGRSRVGRASSVSAMSGPFSPQSRLKPAAASAPAGGVPACADSAACARLSCA